MTTSDGGGTQNRRWWMWAAGFATVVSVLAAELFAPAGSARADATSYAAAILADHPILYYQLDEPIGADTVANSGTAGAPFDGHLVGGASLGPPGLFGSDGALTLDGQTGTVVIPAPGTSISSLSEFTLELWFKTSSSQSGDLAAVVGFPAQVGLFRGMVAAALVEAGGATVRVGGSQTYNDGGWHYLALVDSGSDVSLYMDGELVDSSPLNAAVAFDASQGGAIGSDGNSNFYSGIVDEAAAYPYALSPSHVANHFNAAGLPGPPESLAVNALPFTGYAASEVATFVATFTDTHPQLQPVYAASIDWGDGVSSTGIVTNNDNTQPPCPVPPQADCFDVYGTHTYAHRGDYTVSITVKRSDGLMATSRGLAHIGPPLALSYSSPDLKVVQYIRHFGEIPNWDCLGELVGNLGVTAEQAIAACGGLDISANPDPPDSFTNSSWIAFTKSDQYRGYVRIPSVQITCTGGLVTSVSGAWKGKFDHSLGYTSDGNGGFDPAEEYTEYPLGALFNHDLPKVATSPDQKSVVISYLQASRVATLERVAGYNLLGYDAPFIWTVVRERLFCGGSFVITLAQSDFPTMEAYVDGHLASEQPQSPRLAAFIASGGTTLHPIGDGKLDPVCTLQEIWSGGSQAPVPLPLSPTPTDCELAYLQGYI